MSKTKKEKDLEAIEAFISDAYNKPVMDFYKVFEMTRLFANASKDIKPSEVQEIEMNISIKASGHRFAEEKKRIAAIPKKK